MKGKGDMDMAAMMRMFQQMKGGGGGNSWGGNSSGGGKGGGRNARDPATTVWVGNCPEGVTEEELESNFKQAGPIKKFDLTKGRTVIIEYSTAAGAKQAVKMFNGCDINGSILHVDPWTAKEGGSGGGKSWGGSGGGGGGGGNSWGGNSWGGGQGGRKNRDRSTTVWVGNIPEGITKEEISENFKQAGTIKYANLTKGTRTGIIEYSTAEEAQKAITMFNGSDINGSALHVDAWTKKE